MIYIVSALVVLLGAALVTAAFRSEHLLVIHHRPKARILLERAPGGGYAPRSPALLPLAVLRYGWSRTRSLFGHAPARLASGRDRLKRPAAIAVNVKPCT